MDSLSAHDHGNCELCDQIERVVEAAKALDRKTVARRFHDIYERLAPLFGYRTRPESAVPWEQVPEQNRALMEAVCQELLGPLWEAVAAMEGKDE